MDTSEYDEEDIIGAYVNQVRRFNSGQSVVTLGELTFLNSGDKNQLARKRKTAQDAYKLFDSMSGAFSKDRKSFEAEERVISDKPFIIPLSKYIISVDILIEYKKPSNKYDYIGMVDYEMYEPIRAKIVKFAQDKNIPINLIVNKNGDPWPDKAKKTIIQKMLDWIKL